MALQQPLDDRHLVRVGRGDPVLQALISQGVVHPQRWGHRYSHLGAFGGGDPALGLQILPGHVDLLGSDEAEDLVGVAVLADEGGGQTEPTAGLDVGGGAEDGRRQQVHLVVDDEAPILRAQ